MEFAGIGLPRDLYSGDMRPCRAIVAPGEERLHGVLLSFHHGLNIAV
jgi:hypothetical protein